MDAKLDAIMGLGETKQVFLCLRPAKMVQNYGCQKVNPEATLFTYLPSTVVYALPLSQETNHGSAHASYHSEARAEAGVL